jgi:hypothetical protein
VSELNSDQSATAQEALELLDELALMYLDLDALPPAVADKFRMVRDDLARAASDEGQRDA